MTEKSEEIKEKNEQKSKRKPVKDSIGLFLLRALFIAALIFSGYKILLSSKWYYPQDLFSKADGKRLAVVGAYITPKESVLNVLKNLQIPNKPLYLIDVQGYKNQILSIETVKNVYIRRYWFPARLQIVIEDRVPLITIAPAPDAEPAAFFVEGGKLLSSELLPQNKALYPLKVLTSGHPDDNFINWDENRINEILKLSEKVSLYSGEKVEYIDIRNPNDIYVKIPSVLVRLGEPNDTFDNRIKNLTSIIPNLYKVEQPIKYIDLRWDIAKFIKLGVKANENNDSSI